MITTLIIDDESHARAALKNSLKEFADVFDVIGECENGVDAIKKINSLQPQIIFLDIQMPHLDGFDVLELLEDQVPQVVFVTAYNEYAVQAFEKNALDYLLKPINPIRFSATVKRIIERFESGISSKVTQLKDDRNEIISPVSRILVREQGKVHIIPIEQILSIEAADDYVAIQIADKVFIKQERLQNMEKILDPKFFCRIHRSYLLNVNFLSGVDSKSKDLKVAILKNGNRLPISRSGYAKLKRFL